MTPGRRRLLALGGSLAVVRIALAQVGGRIYRVGVLDSTGRPDEPYYRAFYGRLGELGYSEGRNLEVIQRGSQGRIERLPALAAEISGRQCDVLVAPGSEETLVALEKASRGTPIIVIAVDYDPAAHVANFARPEGRITGVSAVQSVLPAKRLELLKELLPQAKRIAVLSDPGSVHQLEVAKSGAKRAGVDLKVLEFKRAPYDYEGALAEATRTKCEALLVLGSANFVPARPLITRLAREHRLPSMFHHSVWAEAGGLLSYGPNFSDIFRRAAEQVGRLLGGARPAEIPLELPQRFELVVNMKTATAIGLRIPQEFLIRADRVIEG